ncbi:MAG: hypothetical protein Q7S38_01430 [bacterium]|nr:hypothetical protein [bacterium]
MIDTAQIVVLFVVVALSALLLILGVQVFFILKDLRRAVTKANKVLDDTSIITETVSGPISSLSTLTSGIKIGASLLKLLKKKKIFKSLLGKEEDE